MQKRAVIKWLHRLTTGFLLIAVIILATIVYLTLDHGKKYHIIASKKISEDISLYITQYEGGNTTVPDIYRYYLNRQAAPDEAQRFIEKQKPFLVADNDGAAITANGNIVSVDFTGRIFEFDNSSYFEKHDKPHFILIRLTAQPDSTSQ
jgi:hypothetical protein